MSEQPGYAAIRHFRSADYPAVAEIGRLCAPRWGISETMLRHWDATRDPRCHHYRAVAVNTDGQIVGSVQIGQNPEMLIPGVYTVTVRVHPDSRRRGVGGALYQAALEHLAPLKPVRLLTSVGEDQPQSVRFAERRGFVEAMRSWVSILDVARCDLSQVADPAANLAADGIDIRSLAELTDDPGRYRKVFDLDNETSADVPLPEPFTPFDYDWYVNAILKGPMTIEDGLFVATHGNAYVGMTALVRRGESDELGTGYTGVSRPYRRRGIALALKLAAIRWAKANGYARIVTDNATTNTGMLAINNLLGYARQPADIDFYSYPAPL